MYSIIKEKPSEKAINQLYEDNIPMNLIQVALYWNTSVKISEYLVNEALAEYHRTHERTYTSITGIQFINQEKSVKVNTIITNSMNCKLNLF